MQNWTVSDDKRRRFTWTAIGEGALTGAAAGLLVGLGLGGAVATLAGLGIGILLGGVFGKLISSRISPEEWETPTRDYPNVGMHAPDTT